MKKRRKLTKLDKYWNKVGRCKHEWSPNYSEYAGTCQTEYCGSINVCHCLKCGVYESDCACHSNSGFSGWSPKRHDTEYKKKKFKPMPFGGTFQNFLEEKAEIAKAKKLEWVKPVLLGPNKNQKLLFDKCEYGIGGGK